MKKQLDHVTEFHKVYGVGYEKAPTTQISNDIVSLRHRLMAEENEEYLEAARQGDLEGVADALGDMLYILCGTIITHGLQNKIEAIFEAIQESNMSKLGADGKPIYREDGKVMKGPEYFPPKIKEALKS